MGGRTNNADSDDVIIQVLSDHEHVIDCVEWAPAESARTIENAHYNGGGGADNANDVSTDADGALNETTELNTSAAAQDLDESRMNASTRMTTKERI